ncbi:hypothetical protein QYG_1188 [Escherichia coli B7-1]|uniref:Uncharacterized protein n=1 Tax=Shigella flexneri K-227 TaxID=766147 RepID=F5NSY9_SHIFL|nr:hypothetical protein ECH74042_A5252 [Escherichia coli O157:H7 str. EC4042]EGJ89941.1 hypothetical protein SF274771_1401 [Shigella flexneri 2747-71]EGK27764.1 hypothetical protein SFK272_1619 [Shigella flexneri K-272]EGK39052.1 hypothetical protein SFK227_1259 [Shigella flexneri K-227]EHW13304.1 hypothetical protein ECDEC8A_1383 [Escherichia coli DEC8A]EIQ11551.1 hypothetical protein SF285071_1304 [Shigella flexneri 2850-71]EKJ21739.1 hypothetical protein ECEC1865_1519 [Escherichia coli EC1
MRPFPCPSLLKQEILRNNPFCPTDHPRSNGVRRIDLSGS